MKKFPDWIVPFIGLCFLHAALCELSILRHGGQLYCVASGEDAGGAVTWTKELPHLGNLKDVFIFTAEKEFWVRPGEGDTSGVDCFLNRGTGTTQCAEKPDWSTETWWPPADYDPSQQLPINNIPIVHATEDICYVQPLNSFENSTEKIVAFKTEIARILLMEGNERRTTNRYRVDLNAARGNMYAAWKHLGTNSPIQLNTFNTPPVKFKDQFGHKWIQAELKVIRQGQPNQQKDNLSMKVNGGKVYSGNDNFTLNMNYFCIESTSKPGFWWTKKYQVLKAKVKDPLWGSFAASNSAPLCVSMTYFTSTAAPFGLLLNTMRREVKSVAGWNVMKETFNVSRNVTYNLKFDLRGRAREDFAVGELRICNPSEYFVTRISFDKDAICTAQLINGIKNELKAADPRDNHNAFVYACPMGKFGSNCERDCSRVTPDSANSPCQGVQACNAQFCSCMAGYRGTDCTERCSAGTYGPGCSKRCSLNCREGCDGLTGTCLGGCISGWTPPLTCNERCSSGRYGVDCKERCERCEGLCHPTTGHCNTCKSALDEPPLCTRAFPWLPASANITVSSTSDSIELQGDTREIRFGNKRNEDPSRFEQIQSIIGILVQYKVQGEDWHKGTIMPITVNNQSFQLKQTGLNSSTRYELRILFQVKQPEVDTNMFVNESIKIINATTLCKIANQSDITCTRDNISNPMDWNILIKKEGICDLSNYRIRINGIEQTLLENDSYNTKIHSKDGPIKVVTKNESSSQSLVSFECLEQQHNPPDESSGPTVVVMTFLTMLILLTIGFGLFLWRREKQRKSRRTDQLVNSNANGGGRILDEFPQFNPRPRDSPPPRLPPSSHRKPPAPAAAPARAPAPSTSRQSVAAGSKAHSDRVSVGDLKQHVTRAMASGEFHRQHALFPRGQTAPWVEGSRPEQKSKNRYANLIAYDHTRVKLAKLPGNADSHYINANYIDGYKHERAYIATQGPKQVTLDDFWRMIWQEDVRIIVMLANLVEQGKAKVALYWPDTLRTVTYGSIQVRLIKEDVSADYTFRKLEVCKGGELRQVTQLHYTSWPDHGVPKHPSTLADFMRHLQKVEKSTRSNGPLVVHCSAGVGRTGTVLLAHAGLRMAEAEGAVDLLAMMAHMRSQRPNMVDNPEQYVLAFQVVMEQVCVPERGRIRT